MTGRNQLLLNKYLIKAAMPRIRAMAMGSAITAQPLV